MLETQYVYYVFRLSIYNNIITDMNRVHSNVMNIIPLNIVKELMNSEKLLFY